VNGVTWFSRVLAVRDKSLAASVGVWHPLGTVDSLRIDGDNLGPFSWLEFPGQQEEF
jgi:hypothetical protein